MAEMKLSCPECGQHISCNDAWAGHQIECPACHSHIVVPQIPASSVTAPVPPASPSEPSKVTGPRLSAGVTQVARSTAHAPAPLKKIIPRRPRSNNSLLGYAILVVVIAAVAGVGYFYGLPLLKDALQQAPSSGPPASAGRPPRLGRPLPIPGLRVEALNLFVESCPSRQSCFPFVSSCLRVEAVPSAAQNW
jgi:DNA-directed RNA polymerase subunit RPC12/RpoP